MICRWWREFCIGAFGAISFENRFVDVGGSLKVLMLFDS